MEDNKEDIFSGYAKFGEEEKPKAEERSFKAGFSNLGDGIIHILKGFWHIFSKKFRMNLIVLLLIIALVGALFYLVGFNPLEFTENKTQEKSVKMVFPSTVDTSLLNIESMESVIAESCISERLEQIDIVCADTECTNCEVIEECPECICETDIVDVIYYQCLDGMIEESKSECNRLPMGLKTEDYAINDSILLTLNNVDYELFQDGEFDGVIKLINVSVYNAAGYDIKPKLKIYLYENWAADEPFKKVITFDERIVHSDADSNEGITWTEPSNLNFLKKQKTMKLQLFDVAEDEDQVVVELIAGLDYS
jgi:hypothetical protein